MRDGGCVIIVTLVVGTPLMCCLGGEGCFNATLTGDIHLTPLPIDHLFS